MSKKNALVYTILMAIGFISSSRADQKLTFEDSIGLAVKSNLEVQASYEALKSSEANKKSVRSAFFPKVSATLSYDKENNELKSGSNLTSNNYGASLSLTQNLFNGFQDYANLKIADGQILSSQADLQETKAQISYDLKNAVAAYFYAKDSLSVSLDIKKRREDNLRMVELRFENGRENKGSVMLSKAYLEQANLDLLRAENAMDNSLIFLRRVLNLPEDEMVEITTTPAFEEMSSGLPDFNGLIENTPDAKKFKATLNNASATLESNKSNFLPNLDVSGSVGKTGNDFFPDDNRRWTVGTSLTWSLFDGGKDFYATNSASLLVKSAEKRLENQTLEIRRVLKETYTDLIEALATVKVSNAFLTASKVRSDIARSKYNNGLSNFDEWDLIENDLITRQKDYILKIRDRLIAEAAWEKAQGTGVIP